jgi:hypothetical protein
MNTSEGPFQARNIFAHKVSQPTKRSEANLNIFIIGK